jgi:hypothetical protein
MQINGSLVLSNVTDGSLIWTNGVGSPNASYCNVQVDGNFVCMRNQGASSYWAAGRVVLQVGS